ncbi:outer membrane protein assembly factor BamB family protein [Paenibacillus sp. QZ-Y1]|uniref:outer membrane protein assembly factor BamB family protein n=1 Tax=Paenibacillus sp. QZ-Y1 TaxID=3414511 RepID=UPI003F7A3D30
MKLKFAKSLLVASLLSPILAFGTPAYAKELPQPEWVYDVTYGEWSLPFDKISGIVVDSEGNQSLLGEKFANNKSYLENMNPTTGQIRWSIRKDFFYTSSEDGYIFILENNNQISAMHLATGKKLWTRTLPSKKEDYYPSYDEGMYPGKNGSLYVVSHSKDDKATLYYYDSAGRRTKKYTLPYIIVGIEGDYVFAKTYSDDPNTYIISLATGKKIRTATNGISFIPVTVLKDNTLITQNVVKNTLTLKAFHPTGKLKWTKELPYVSEKTEVYTLQDRFLFIDGKNNTLKLYASDGKLLASKSYKPMATGYNRLLKTIDVSKDQLSFMFTIRKGKQYEIKILDSKNLNLIKSFTEGEYYNKSEYEISNNKTEFIIIDSYGKSISKYKFE